MITHASPSHAVLTLSSGERKVSVQDLETIKSRLVTALQRQSPQADYATLAEEARQATCFVGPDGVARIGLWTLQARDGEAALVRQQLPRTSPMLIHVAYLAEDDGEGWSVTSLAVDKLRAR